ncbi:MAG: hypothetical protein CMJ80_17835 [Planctomycetaceae bacterium]|nr:hypothetical protein [Planctomycetaceae bacterium]
MKNKDLGQYSEASHKHSVAFSLRLLAFLNRACTLKPQREKKMMERVTILVIVAAVVAPAAITRKTETQ